MFTRGVIAWYWVGALGLIGAVLALPAALAPVAWASVGVGAAVTVLAAVRLRHPRLAWPWWVLAAGLLLGTGADTLYRLGQHGAPAGLTVASNLAYLGLFACAATAALRFARTGGPNADGAGLTDGLTITIVLLLAVWVFVVSPADAGLLMLADPLVAGYLIGDVLLIATLIRLFLVRRHTPAVTLLIAGAAAGLVADIAFGVHRAETGLTTVLWLLMYACWGAAAVHPSMVRLTEPETRPARDLTARHLVVVVMSALGAPAVLLVQALGGEVRDGVVLAVGSAVLFLLSLARVASTANVHRRSLVYREHHDTLTGLSNRKAFARQLAEEIDRSGPETAVLLVDLDDFKLVNDTMGHSAGDEVLVTVAQRLSRALGRHGVAARLGGDEFAVLLSGAPDVVEQTAGRVAVALAEPITYAGREVRITASIGVATAGQSAEAQQLMSQASLALQAARAEGGSWTRYREDVHGRLVERLRLRAALTRAVHDGAFSLRFQPIVSIDGSATMGFEALVRWSHPTLGPVPAEQLIELAEETGLIEPIGDWVLWRAVAMAAHWYRTLPSAPYISVNVSALQFRTPGFAERVDRVLVAAGLPPSHLMIELTESVLLREADEVWAELAVLRDTGVRLALDDFGTGFSTLTYLLHTPIDFIKIDKSFVSTLTTSSRHHGVVEGIVHLARTLGLEVVAEGIETPAHRDLLAEMGCPYGQGFLYSVPLTSTEANAWLAAEHEPDLSPESPGEPKNPYAHSGLEPTTPGTLPA